MRIKVNFKDGVFSLEINFYSHETSYPEPKELCQSLMKFTSEIAKQFDDVKKKIEG